MADTLRGQEKPGSGAESVRGGPLRNKVTMTFALPVDSGQTLLAVRVTDQ